jgi:hypothetical protein
MSLHIFVFLTAIVLLRWRPKRKKKKKKRRSRVKNGVCIFFWALTFFVPATRELQVWILKPKKEVPVGLATRSTKKKENPSKRGTS